MDTLQKIDLLLVDVLPENNMDRRDGTLLLSNETLSSQDRLIFYWQVMFKVVSLQMRGQPGEDSQHDSIRKAVSMFLAYDYIK